jgi:beta-galactosidase
VTPVYCYTDYPSAELFVNGVSQGRRTKDRNQKLDRYRLRWNDVVYQPGELRVVVYDQEGRAAGEEIIRTAGKPDHLLLEADKTVLCADGEDMTFVTVSMVDRMGNLVPDADHSLTFEVEGQGAFQAACNGDAKSLEPFTQPRMKLFNGKLVVVVRSTSCPGEITLRVKAEKQKMEQTIHFSSK